MYIDATGWGACSVWTLLSTSSWLPARWPFTSPAIYLGPPLAGGPAPLPQRGKRGSSGRACVLAGMRPSAVAQWWPAGNSEWWWWRREEMREALRGRSGNRPVPGAAVLPMALPGPAWARTRAALGRLERALSCSRW